MTITSALAIYVLFWVLTLFVVLPFGVRTVEEAGDTPEPGHADSAPHNFRFWRVMLRTTLASAALFGLFYLNYIFGWVGSDVLDWILPKS